MRLLTHRLAAAVAFSALLALPALGETVRARGPVTTMDGRAITVKGRDGDVTFQLADNWTVGGRRPATLAEIKPGDFIGVGATPMAGGGLRAAEIFIFPAGMKAGEGHRAWDVLPEGTMTNATVSETVRAIDGQTLKLTYPGGEKLITVPEDASIAAAETADRGEVQAGAIVMVSGERQPDGSLRASRVTVNKAGVKAP